MKTIKYKTSHKQFQLLNILNKLESYTKVRKFQITFMKERNNITLKYTTSSDPYMLTKDYHENALDFLHIQIVHPPIVPFIISKTNLNVTKQKKKCKSVVQDNIFLTERLINIRQTSSL